MSVPRMLLVHSVAVEAYAGEGSHGSAYAASAPVACLLSEEATLVRAPDGQQVVSSASYIAPPDHNPPPKSRVTLPDGRITTVIIAGRAGVGIAALPANTEVKLQ